MSKSFWMSRWIEGELNMQGRVERAAKRFRAAYDRLEAAVSNYARWMPSEMEFLLAPAGFGFESFMYKEGDVVRHLETTKIGVVEGYDYSGCWTVIVRQADGLYHYPPASITKADVPKEILDVARSQIKHEAAGQCPLMKECEKECDNG